MNPSNIVVPAMEHFRVEYLGQAPRQPIIANVAQVGAQTPEQARQQASPEAIAQAQAAAARAAWNASAGTQPIAPPVLAHDRQNP